MMFLLKCQRCGNRMKYQTNSSVIGKRKACVYCNFSMDVRKSVLREIFE
ncbi:hypothetical protein J4470_00335 [Candidatus Woesearchaeota archaeon]|nr:hypothetical protein [Candidatus Woesearchaeota archaeon]